MNVYRSMATLTGGSARQTAGAAGGRSTGSEPGANGREINGSAPTMARFVWSLDRSSDVGRALLAATRRLTEAGSDTPQLDSALLMAHVLGVSKTWIYAYPNRRLTETEIGRFEELVRRRMAHEPIAYLVGFKSFFGLDITVDRRVLIPRPETELLVERALAFLKHLLGEGRIPRVADIGTGSGAVAVAIAVNEPTALVYATDTSDDALAVAAQNVWRYGVGEQVQLLPGHLIEPLPEPVHLLVANLPYVPTSELASLPPQVQDYEPMAALDGGPDGLRVMADLFAALETPRGRGLLQPGGQILLEIGAEQGDAVMAMARRAYPEALVELESDYAGLPRLVIVSLP